MPHFTVASGPCTLAWGGRCVGRWPGGYGPDEDCTIAVAGGGAAGGVLGGCPVFDINHGTKGDFPDTLTLPDGSQNSGDICPASHQQPAVLAAGQDLAWHSDGEGQGGGAGFDYSAHKYTNGNGLPYNFDGPGGGWQICFA